MNKTLLPEILVRNQISGETGKIKFGRIKYNSGLAAKDFRFVYSTYWYSTVCGWVGVDCKVSGMKFMAVSHADGCGMLLARVTTISPF